jgi:NitT/TauT family transport system permease protein
MFHNRIIQFLILFVCALSFLFAIKWSLQLSDYIIPSFNDILGTTESVYDIYIKDMLESLLIAITGHIIAICLACSIGIIGRLTHWMGEFIKAGAYHIQAYPIVAIAPIIFILFGDGLFPRLLITSMICYFPLLLTFVGIFTEPVENVEHFYKTTHTLTGMLEIKIRAFEHRQKIQTVIEGSATLAMVGTIVAEFLSAESGIGHQISIALSQSDLSKVLIALFIIGLSTALYLTALESIGNGIQKRLA